MRRTLQLAQAIRARRGHGAFRRLRWRALCGEVRGVSQPWVLVTGNDHKWHEAQRILGVTLERVRLDLPELQEESIAAVAREKAFTAWDKLQRPLIVEDAGIELSALGGFPGPFIKWWERLGGLTSICRALDTAPTRQAFAVCALGIATERGVHVVEGRISGQISREPTGDGGFGWDSIFIPDGGEKTFAQMTAEEKDAQSHRRRAWEALRKIAGDPYLGGD